MTIYTIYRITCIPNNKVYIGYTKQTIEQRFQQHIRAYGKSKKYKLPRAIEKHGPENFFVEEIYQTLCKQHAGEMEDFFICSHDSISTGYNTARGGQGGCIALFKDNPEYDVICKKISDTKRANPGTSRESALKRHRTKTFGMHGKEHSDETKKKMSTSSAWRNKSDEHMEKIRSSYRKTVDAPGYIHPNANRKRSLEEIELSKANRPPCSGHQNSRARAVLYNGKAYGCMKYVQDELGISHYKIRRMISDGTVVLLHEDK